MVIYKLLCGIHFIFIKNNKCFPKNIEKYDRI